MDATITSSASFVLELYYEPSITPSFAEALAAALKDLIRALAPHIALTVEVLPANDISRSEFVYLGTGHNVPNHVAREASHQSILITDEDIGASGWAGPGQGCVSKRAIETKMRRGGDSADVVLHEWLHTLEGQQIGERRLPSPDSNEHYPGYELPSGRSKDGDDTWHEWYRFVLRP